MIAGQLELQLFANIARISDDMRKVESTVTGAMGKIDRAAGIATKALGALGVGISFAALTNLAKNAINAQDALDEMSQRTGVAVESLAGLDWAAKLSGTNLEVVTKALKAVSTQALDAQRGLKTSQENFDALGISVLDANGQLKTSESLLIEAADKFAVMRNETEKTAIATKLFGRAGMDLIPMLDQGSAGIAALVAEGQRLNPVTSESAALAGQFNDNLDRLKGSMRSFGVEMINNALPALTDWTGKLVDAISHTNRMADEMDKVNGKINTFTVQEVAGMVQAAFEDTQAKKAQVEQLQKLMGTLNPLSEKYVELNGTLNTHNLELAALETHHSLLVARLEQLRNGAEPVVTVIEEIAGGTVVLTEEQQKLIDKTRELTEKIAIERAQLAMTGREAAIFKAVWEAHNAGVAPEAIRLIADTAGALYDEQRQLEATTQAAKDRAEAEAAAAKEVADARKKAEEESRRASAEAALAVQRQWEQTHNYLSGSFVDLMDNGGNAFDNIAKAFEKMVKRMVAEWAASGLMRVFGMGAPTAAAGVGTGAVSALFRGGGFAAAAGGAASVLSTGGAVISAAEYAQLMGGASAGAGGAAGAGLAAGLKSALTAIPGWGWALAGAAALTMMFDKKSTPSFNSGFLLHDLPGVSADRKFSVDPFASGLAPVGFNRRSTTGEAAQVIDLFRAIDESIVNIARNAGKTVSASGLTGLAETGLGSGIFFGAAGEDGRPGMAVEQQIQMFATQLIQSLRGQIEDRDLDAVLAAGGVDQMLAKLEQVLEIQDDIADQALEAAQQIERGYDVAFNAAQRYIDNLLDEQSRFYDSQRAAIIAHYDEQMRIEEALHNRRLSLFQSLQAYTSSLKLGNLSTLSNAEQLAFAQGQFRSLASTANNTSLSMEERMAAAEGLQGAADQYLNAGRSMFASSSQYKDVFAEVMQQLEAAKFLGTNQPFEGSAAQSAIENAMLDELEKLNDQMAILAQQISTQLSPMFGALIQAMLAAGKAPASIANLITSMGPNAVAASNQYLAGAGIPGTVASYATTDDDIRNAVAAINAASSSEEEAVLSAVAMAKEYNVSSGQIASALGMSSDEAAALLAKYNIPMFASGGIHKGGLRVVGERGPELEFTGPSRIFSNPETIDIIRGGSDQPLARKMGEVSSKLDKVIVLLETQNRAVFTEASMTTAELQTQTAELKGIKDSLRKEGVGSRRYRADAA